MGITIALVNKKTAPVGAAISEQLILEQDYPYLGIPNALVNP